jgi:uncharacterized protein YndB with AHSA1/START domain
VADAPGPPSETERVFEYETRVAASPDTVFGYFTDPEKMVQWMGTEATLDPRPGGVCRINPSGHSVMSGEFVEVDPPRRIVFTWGWELEMFATPPQSTIVEVSLTPDGDQTILRLTHRGLQPPAFSFHRVGWEHYLPRLERVAGGTDPGPDPWRDLETATKAMRAAAGLI